MKEKHIIWSLFDELRPIIIAKLLNPEDKYVRSGGVQLIVPINTEEFEVLLAEEVLTALPTDLPNIWGVYPDEQINVPWKEWETSLIISLGRDDIRKYRLTVSLSCYGCEDVVSYGETVSSGTIDQITQAVNSNRFPSNASSVFNACCETVARKIEQSEQNFREVNLFANTNITDYDSVMKFVDFLKDKKILKSKGYGIELFRYDHVVSLIDKSSKSVKVLVDRKGKAQFCRLEDFPAALLDMIRSEKRYWNLDVHHLSVGNFDDKGHAFVTWVISPYSYFPMDEDGFGEEEEFEVAVTCHINTDGQLIDTPVWKPYNGPRR